MLMDPLLFSEVTNSEAALGWKAFIHKQGLPAGKKKTPPKSLPEASVAPYVAGGCAMSSSMLVGQDATSVASHRKSSRKSWTGRQS
jgi:hypothetical protein